MAKNIEKTVLSALREHYGSDELPPQRKIVLAGLPGAGKTTLQKRLIGTSTLPIDSDVTLGPEADAVMNYLTGERHDRDSDFYIEHVRPVVMEGVALTARMADSAGMGYIISAPYLSAARTALSENVTLKEILNRQFGITPDIVVWMTVNADDQFQRMVKRSLIRDDVKLGDFESYRESVEDVATGITTDIVDIVVDSSTGTVIIDPSPFAEDS